MLLVANQLLQHLLTEWLIPTMLLALAVEVSEGRRLLPYSLLRPSVIVERFVGLGLIQTFDPVVARGILESRAHQCTSP